VKTITKEQFDEFVRGYITAALWSTHGDDGEFLDQDYDRDDLTETAKIKMRAHCQDFVDAQETDLLAYAVEMEHVRHRGQGTAWDHAGHDFWFTAGGHGAGFWDRGLGDLGDRLSEAAGNYNNPHLFVTEEDQIEAE